MELARSNAKKKMLGNVKFIGELGRHDLLTEAILHKCIKTLLEKQRDEKYADMSEDLECLCKMMPTIGRKLDQGEAVKLMDQYFERMKKLCGLRSVNDRSEWVLPMRIRFMLQDLIELRDKQWQQRQTQIDQAPKTMHEVRNGALIEEMAAAALTASTRAPQESGIFNISSLSLNSNSAMMMSMYQQLSQQPNASLLNAINTKIATNKSNMIRNKKQQQGGYCTDSNEYVVSEDKEKLMPDEISTEVLDAATSMNLVTRQSSSKQNFVKQLAPNLTEQQTNPQKTNFSFQRTNQRTNPQSITDQQKLQKTNYLKSSQFIDTEPQKSQIHHQLGNRTRPATGNFNWNQPHPTGQTNDQTTNTTTHINQNLHIKTHNLHSISSSSSPFSSNSSLSASPPLPVDQPKPTTEPTTFYNNTNTNTYKQPLIQQRQHLSYTNSSNNSMSRNALGVSTNDFLPLNKPIIAMDKVALKSGANLKAKAPLNIFSANIYNLAPVQVVQVFPGKSKSSQLIDESVKKSIVCAVDRFLFENNKNEERGIENVENVLDKCLNELKDFKLINDKYSEAVHIILTHSLSKTSPERLNISRLFKGLHNQSTNEMTTELYLTGFRHILQNLANLESEYHCVKSNISMFAARAVCDCIITFDDLGLLMRHGAHYPLFFLCMQNMHKLRSKEWLRSQLEKSKINLIEMLPVSDRHKDRLIQILEDRELSFVYPMLKIESALLEKIQSDSMTNGCLREWITNNVDVNVTSSTDFIHSLVTCIVKNAAENSVLSSEFSDLDAKMDKVHVLRQKELIEKYQGCLQECLGLNVVGKEKRTRQVEAIYAMQVYANSKGFPKYFLAHLFNQMYDLEIVDEEAFLQWKDEINENYPNKGHALFYLQRWFSWLQEASEESSGSDGEHLGEKPSKPNVSKENMEQIVEV